MSALKAIDLIVPDVPAAVAFFREAVGLRVLQEYDRFAEIDAGTLRLWLSPDALVPVTFASGVILHLEVSDVRESHDRAVAFGAESLKAPFTTEWGTVSALVKGPAGTIVDFFHEKPVV